MKTSILSVLPLLTLAACGWDLPHSGRAYLQDPLWDARGIQATADGLYVPMPHTGGIALLAPGAEPRRIELGEGRVVNITVPPAASAATLAAVIERYRCETDDKKEARQVDRVAECADEDLKIDVEIDLIADGVVASVVPLDTPFRSMVWNAAGTHAIAWTDAATAAEIDGVVNLTSVTVIDTVAGVATAVPIGFAATDVLFDDAGARAIVLSQSAVAVIDLATSPPTRDVTFALTLDPDQVVTPVGVQLTPDGDYALISVRGSTDLYVLDLVNNSVNIVTLDLAPSAMHVDATDDVTVLVSAATAAVDILDHRFFDVARVQLDEAMESIIDGDGFDLLYGRNHRDVYRLDPLTGDLVEFRLQSPLLSLHLAPTEEFAIAFTTPGDVGGRPGMEVLDLRDDRGHSFPFLLEGVGIDAKFTVDDAGLLHALILQTDVTYVYALDLYGGSAREIELDVPPIGIGARADGGFYVTHDDPLGLVSLFDPATDAIETVAGFGALGMFDDIDFVVPPGQEEAP